MKSKKIRQFNTIKGLILDEDELQKILVIFKPARIFYN